MGCVRPFLHQFKDYHWLVHPIVNQCVLYRLLAATAYRRLVPALGMALTLDEAAG